MNLTEVAWPLTRLPEALSALARQSGLTAVSTPTIPPPTEDSLGRWLPQTAVALGFEAEPVTIPYPDVTTFLQSAAPAICRLPGDTTPQFLALLKSKRSQLVLLSPDLTTHHFSVEAVRTALSHALEAPLLPEIEQLFHTAHIPVNRQKRARTALLQERLSQSHIGGCWRLEAAPGSRFWQQLRQANVPQRLFLFLASYGLHYGLLILSFWLLGRTLFQGQWQPGWLPAWGLLLLTSIPLRLFVAWQQALTAVSSGGLLQRRLLFGALRLHPDEIRHMGAGQLVGRVFEAEVVADLAVNAGLMGLMGLVELLFAFWILSQGAAGLTHVLLLLAWCAFLVGLGRRYYLRVQAWLAGRLHLSHDLIEQMVGQRTRLTQLPPERWHDGEDESLSMYTDQSQKVDQAGAWFMAVPSPGWLVLGLIGLLPAFVAAETSAAALAVSIGGLLSAMLAFGRLAQGMTQLITTAVVWQQIAPLFEAAARPQTGGKPGIVIGEGDTAVPTLHAQSITFGYQNHAASVLHNCDLHIARGDKILLEGESGGGKSTLISLLTGLRQPNGGLLMVNGLDRQTMGQTMWQRHVTAAPQFHENHVLGNTFAFNLLLSRNWPPQPGDMPAAYELCQELGLGELLERMPGGLLQMVGEIGWQLSHGERSRLFIARALLQGADLVILDESFAALDPQTLQQTMACVHRHAPALLVIAHP